MYRRRRGRVIDPLALAVVVVYANVNVAMDVIPILVVMSYVLPFSLSI